MQSSLLRLVDSSSLKPLDTINNTTFPMRRASTALLARGSWVCTQCRASYSSVANPRSTSKSKTNLPNTPARTRFAPSPTGYLHLGSLRTALFNYLLAKRTGGQFLLRIEDTDQRRTIPDAEQRLYSDLQWAGLQWDEGPTVGGPYGPYRQSERTDIYRSHAHELISNGHAYRCFCSADRLDSFARHRSQAGLSPGYDRKCAEIAAKESEDRAAKGETHVVRLKTDGYPMFNDLVYGKTGQNRPNNKLDLIDRVYDDPIMLKSDGHPTYHLANVVDDHCMKITHVIRGTEWIPSTPMHVALYNAFNWTPPDFGHVPLLVDQMGQKLSKRNADIDLSSFKDKQGIFPETMVNFSALLGWSHTQKSDVFNLDELEQIVCMPLRSRVSVTKFTVADRFQFNLKITRGNTVVSFEKLWFLQKAHAQRAAMNTNSPTFEDMVARVSKLVQENHSTEQLNPILKSRSIPEYVTPILQADAKSYTTAQEFLQRNSTFFTSSLTRPSYNPTSPPAATAAPATATEPIPITALHTAAAALSLVPASHWTVETHRFNISSYDGSAVVTPPPTANTNTSPASSPQETEKARVAADKRFKKELYHYLRWALSAGAPGPGIPETMAILGRDETVRRLDEARGLTTALDSTPTPTPSKGPEEDRTWMGTLASRK